MQQNLKEALDRLGLKQVELARLLDVSPRTVSLWATGDAALPGPVAAYLRVLLMSDRTVIARELKRLPSRSKMLDEGVYGIAYRDPSAETGGGTALAVLRNGKILGADRWGGVFSGSFEFDSVEEKNRVRLSFQVPPEGELVTGYVAGSTGAILDVTAAFARAEPSSTATVEIGGGELEIELAFMGPLPN